MSAALRTALLAWSLGFDQSLDADDPDSTGYIDEEATGLIAEGARLHQRLQAELGPGWQVTYQPPRRKSAPGSGS